MSIRFREINYLLLLATTPNPLSCVVMVWHLFYAWGGGLLRRDRGAGGPPKKIFGVLIVLFQDYVLKKIFGLFHCFIPIYYVLIGGPPKKILGFLKRPKGAQRVPARCAGITLAARAAL